MLELEFRVLAGFFFKLKPRLDRVFQASSPKKAWKNRSGRAGLTGRAEPDPPLVCIHGIPIQFEMSSSDSNSKFPSDVYVK